MGLATKRIAIETVVQPRPLPRKPRPPGFVLALTVILLAVLAGLTLHLLTEARIRLNAAEQTWEEERLGIAAATAAGRALQACADEVWKNLNRERDPDAPHILWDETRIDPNGIRIRVRLLDAQRRFDLNNILSIPGTTHPPLEAIRTVTVLLRLHGDPAPSPRVDALVHRLTPPSSPAEKTPSSPVPMVWDDLLRLPEFGVNYLRNPAGKDSAHAESAPPVPSFAALLPCPAEDRPVPVNVNTATRETLCALLGENRGPSVERLLAGRRDTPFRSLLEAAARTGFPPDRFLALKPWLTVQSEWFDIESRAEARGHAVFIRGLAQRDSAGNVTVIRWCRAARISTDAYE